LYKNSKIGRPGNLILKFNPKISNQKGFYLAKAQILTAENEGLIFSEINNPVIKTGLLPLKKYFTTT
jgi:hypothetical protein